MASEYMIANQGKPLNGDNFTAWRIRMNSVLTALGISQYITNEQNIENLPAEQQQKNAIAKSIILNNIEDKIYPMINETDSAYELMENLKTLYEQDKDITLQDWMEKLKQIKIKKTPGSSERCQQDDVHFQANGKG